jgi:hypothetical protein
MRRYIALVSCLAMIMAGATQIQITPAAAQDVFNGRAAPAEGNPNCPPPIINGITPKNWSCRTGTQGVEGNPNCPPPTIIINGQPTTPRNWSCKGGTPSARNAPVGPFEIHRPGPPPVPGAANPCQPGGPGGYNYLDNPVGTPLPPGCVRSTGKTSITAKTDSMPPGSYLVPPVGPPGSYIQPDGRPGSYIVPPYGPPGSYIQPGGRLDSYVDTTSNSGPGGSGRQEQAAPGGGSGSGATANVEPGNAVPYRQGTGQMRGSVTSYGGASPYRQDTAAMQGATSGGGFTPGASGPARKTTTAKKPSTAAANSQAARTVNGIINLFGNGP